MPKIKVKKLVGLEELLDKISNKEIEAKHYLGHNGTDVYPGEEYLADFEIIDFVPGDSFEIEVEQEIDANTPIDKLVAFYKHHNGTVDLWNYERERSILSALNRAKDYDSKNINFYVMDDDEKMYLIWKDGEFVD